MDDEGEKGKTLSTSFIPKARPNTHNTHQSCLLIPWDRTFLPSLWRNDWRKWFLTQGKHGIPEIDVWTLLESLADSETHPCNTDKGQQRKTRAASYPDASCEPARGQKQWVVCVRITRRKGLCQMPWNSRPTGQSSRNESSGKGQWWETVENAVLPKDPEEPRWRLDTLLVSYNSILI